MTDRTRMVRYVRNALVLHKHSDPHVMAEALADRFILDGFKLPPVPSSDLGRRAPLTEKTGRVIAN